MFEKQSCSTPNLTVCVYTIQQKNLQHYKLKFKFVDLKINKSDFKQIVVITLTFLSKIIIKQKLKQTLDLLPATFQSKNFMAKKLDLIYS